MPVKQAQWLHKATRGKAKIFLLSFEAGQLLPYFVLQNYSIIIIQPLLFYLLAPADAGHLHCLHQLL
jgi:hypothetical protein